MKFFKRLALTAFCLLTLVSAFPVPSSAATWSPFGAVNCASKTSGTETSANSVVCKDKNKSSNPLAGPNGLIMRITNIVAMLAGIAAVIIIVLAGLRFVTAGGSSEDVAGARRTLIYAVVGLIIVILSRTLVAFVLGKI